jgi:rare lipoprotein A
MKKYHLLLFLSFIVFSSVAQVQSGKASFYADKFQGSRTASGEKYKRTKLTAAHKTLPLGTKVKVTNVDNKKSVIVTINDRGPYVEGRIIDVSGAAAEQLGFVNQGIAEVTVEVVDPGDGKIKESQVRVENVSVDEKEFYEFSVDRTLPKGFGVQIGTYQELVNLIRLAENLKKSYKKAVTVQVKVINGVTYYGLILGNFSTHEKADEFRNELKNKFPDAFIMEFNRMQ